MARTHSGEQVLNFTPVLKGRDTLKGIARRRRVSPYRLALFAHDLFIITGAFGLGTWISGVSFFLWDRPIQSIGLLILALIVISYFPTYNLYNYHYIFLRKSHLASLIKSYVWGAFTVGIIIFLYTYPHYLEGRLAIFILFFVAIALLLLSRFVSDHLLNILKSIGLSFLAIGVMDLLSPEETPVIMEHWIGVPIGFSFAAGIALGSRFLVVHVVFNNWLRRRFRRQVAIVGSDEEAARITKHIIDHNAPYYVSGFVDSQDTYGLNMPASKKWLGEIKDLPLITEREKIDEIILTDEAIDKRTLISLLDYCTSQGITIWFPPKLMPIIDMKLYIDQFCGLPLIRLCSQKNSYGFNKIKHSLDAVIVLPAFIVLLPIFLLIGILIKLDSHGPVFYRSKAVGKGGRAFTMYKFRSMRIESDHEIHKDYVARLINGNISEESGKGGVFKVADDPRITRVGKFLRKFSLDELPQLINIVKGEMSLVGPRPCLPYEYEMYKDWHKKRLSIRPGLTCIWQVAGRSAVSFQDLVLLDLYYIYNRSILMDMNIMYETIFAVFGKRGAY
jgi:undecaprenyl-phosphate galactose phosphotransferase